jgi:hypothetical protein
MYDSLLDFWHPSSINNYGIRLIGTNTSHALTTKVQAGFKWDWTCLLRNVHFTVPIWFISPRCSVRF